MFDGLFVQIGDSQTAAPLTPLPPPGVKFGSVPQEAFQGTQIKSKSKFINRGPKSDVADDLPKTTA